MDSHNHKAFAIGDLRRTGKLAHADDLFCDGLAPNGPAALVMAAAVQGDAARLSLLLSDPKVLPDFANAHGITPLMAAAARGHVAVVELLAAHPLVNIGRASRDGWTALHYAAAFDEGRAANALLAHCAPFDAVTKGGVSPFDLARGKPAEDVFWANRDFARLMRQQQPEHPKFNPAPAPEAAAETPPPAAAVETPPPEKDPVREAFFRGVTALGLQSMEEMSRVNLITKMAEMPLADLQDMYKTIGDTGVPFNWGTVFVVAAAVSNIPVMCFLHDKILFETLTLDRALSAAIQARDNRDSAHHLVLWGADPGALHVFEEARNRPIRDAALALGRMGCFEEMALWQRKALSRDEVEKFTKALDEVPLSSYKAANRAVTICHRRRELEGCRTKKLSGIFNDAVRRKDMTEIMAAYAESRRGYILRGTVEFAKADGGAAIAAALMNEQYEFARALIRHGYHLKDAPEAVKSELRLLAPKAKQFAEDHLSGRMQLEPVEDVGRAKRAELRILAAGPIIGGARYGMF